MTWLAFLSGRRNVRRRDFDRERASERLRICKVIIGWSSSQGLRRVAGKAQQ
jgi:hypothetical protein